MKISGIVRNADCLGRVVIPKSYRKNIGMEPGDAMEIFQAEEFVLIRRYKSDKSELENFVDGLSQEKLEELKKIVDGYFN